MVVGHEIIGRIVRVGDAAKKDFKIGDRVGVGAHCNACLRTDCDKCTRNLEQHCKNDFVTTYDSRYTDGQKTYGEYAKFWRGPASFVFHIPAELPSETPAPMLCGGLTVYARLVDHGAGPGKRVGVVGIGGLGHFAVLFAKALKCDKIVGISRSSAKKADALEMGADDYIATAEDADWKTKHSDSLDIIISTKSGPGFKLEDYLTLLDVNGTLVQVGAPEDPIPAFSAFGFIRKGLRLVGSLYGSREQAKEMMELAVREKVRVWPDVWPMSEANQVIVDMQKGRAKYRYVLIN